MKQYDQLYLTCRQTLLCSLLHSAKPDGQTDRQTLPSDLSPCFTGATRSINIPNLPDSFLQKFFWSLLCSQWTLYCLYTLHVAIPVKSVIRSTVHSTGGLKKRPPSGRGLHFLIWAIYCDVPGSPCLSSSYLSNI